MLFDIGANLTHSDFKDDLQAVLDRAKTAGVLQMTVTGASLEGSKQAVALSEQFEGLFATVGVHPHHAEEINDDTLQLLAALAESAKGRGYRRNGARLFSRFYAEGPAAPGLRGPISPRSGSG